MSLYSSIILPFVFGLVGFAEPCSMGINIMFLSSVKQIPSVNRLREILVFMLARASVLAVLGTSVAFLGSQLFSLQSGFFLFLASIYITVGFLMIFSRSLLGKLRNIWIAHWLGLDLKEGAVKKLGLVAGFTIPACAIPLITILLGQSLFLGDLFIGFVGLFVFGLALTLPLAAFLFFQRGMVWLEWIAQNAKKTRMLGGFLLVIVGLATLYSSIYWNQALTALP